MKIPRDCTISLGTENGTAVLAGNFRITTKADCDAFIKAVEQIGSVLADRKPRKKAAPKATPKAA
jgi:hypothetical protein